MLLKQETITHDDIVDLVGPRPFETNTAYQEYVTNRITYDKTASDDDVEDEASIERELTPGLA